MVPDTSAGLTGWLTQGPRPGACRSTRIPWSTSDGHGLALDLTGTGACSSRCIRTHCMAFGDGRGTSGCIRLFNACESRAAPAWRVPSPLRRPRARRWGSRKYPQLRVTDASRSSFRFLRQYGCGDVIAYFRPAIVQAAPRRTIRRAPERSHWDRYAQRLQAIHE